MWKNTVQCTRTQKLCNGSRQKYMEVFLKLAKQPQPQKKLCRKWHQHQNKRNSTVLEKLTYV